MRHLKQKPPIALFVGDLGFWRFRFICKNYTKNEHFCTKITPKKIKRLSIKRALKFFEGSVDSHEVSIFIFLKSYVQIIIPSAVEFSVACCAKQHAMF